MNCFYIDTSSSYLYSGILRNNKLLFEIKKNFGKDLSRYTVSEIDKLFKKSDINPSDINKIIIVSGPGSFTGIRIGMTFAKIFAWSLKKEIITISSLEAMQASVNSKKVLVPIIDARRGYVYAGVYENGNNILQDQYIKLDKLIEFLNKMNKSYLYITNDNSFNYSNIVKYNPNILRIISIYKDRKSVNPHLVMPEYLKLTEAEERMGNLKNDN